MIFAIRRARPRARAAHAEIVTAARRPTLYADLDTPDSLDGRYEAIILHAHLLLRRLRRPDGDPALAQALFDVTFKDFDRSLRELGVGDQGVPHKIKAMGKGAYGRFEAYDAGLADGAEPEILAEALRRNYFGTAEPKARSVDVLADYMRAVDSAFMAESVAALEARRPMFLELNL